MRLQTKKQMGNLNLDYNMECSDRVLLILYEQAIRVVLLQYKQQLEDNHGSSETRLEEAFRFFNP